MILPENVYISKSKSENEEEASLAGEIQKVYSNMAKNINGSFKSSYQDQKMNWTPVLNGLGASGTFTYTHAIGWVFRQGILIDIWGDILWTAAGAAAGALYVEFPYQATNSDGLPFIGTALVSGAAYPAGQYAAISATPNQYRGEFYAAGSGTPLTAIAVTPTGRVNFHIRYIGMTDER